MGHSCENCVYSNIEGFFHGLDKSLLKEIDQRKQLQKYKKSQHIYTQGAPFKGIHCIHQGKVKIVRTTNEDKDSILRLARFGDVLGHYNLMHSDQYTHSAIAIEETKVCFLHKDFLSDLLKTHPKVVESFMEKMTQEMNHAELKISALIQKNVRERLAFLLLSLADSFGVEEDGRVRFEIKLTRDEIGSIIGTVNETVTRFMSEFKDEGLIEEEGKTIYVVDRERLKIFANEKS